MMQQLQFFLSLGLLLGLLTVFTVFLRRWISVFRRWRRGEPVAIAEGRLGLVPWGLVDLVVLFLLILLFQGAAAALVVGRFDFDPTASSEMALEPQVIFVSGLAAANLLWTVVALGAMLLLRSASWRELGFQRGEWSRDLGLGMRAFCMLAPIVYGLQAVLVHYWPSRHPMIEMIRENPAPLLVVLVGFAASIAAPISEELAFRLFFQGWLHNAALLLIRKLRRRAATLATAAPQAAIDGDKVVMGVSVSERRRLNQGTLLAESFGEAPRPPTAPAESELAPAPDGDREILEAEVSPLDPYSPPLSPPISPRDSEPNGDGEGGTEPRETEPHASLPPRIVWTPIFVSALIFALLHYSHGPDWVPLTVLAVGLGYLYQRTQRILPCIVVHMLLNSLSFGMLLIELYAGGLAPN